jgi:hypothetical protein
MRNVLLAAALAILLIGCREEADVERPTALIESPLAGGLVTTDEGLRLVATLADNQGLLQYKVTISGIDSLNDVGADSTVSLIYIEGVPNKEKTIYLDQIIELSPNTFNGQYQMTLACIDMDGNESLRDTVLFEIKNSIDSDPPMFSITGIDTGDTLYFGDGFSPGGMITDSQSLIFASIYVGSTDGSHILTEFEFPFVTDNRVVFNDIWFFQVDSSWSQGAYHMYFTAWDNYSGVSHSIPFHVKY